MPTRIRYRSEDVPSRTASPSPSPSPSQTTTAAGNGLAMRRKDDERNGSASKRKRTNAGPSQAASSRQRISGPPGISSQDEDGASDAGDIYDPDQPLQERRVVQKGLRELLKGIAENSEEYLQGDSRGLQETILKANELSKQLKQTTEATIDSRLLVSTTDLSYRKALRLTQGSLSQGIDVDEFVSKAITYMRNGSGISDDSAPELSSTQRQRRTLSRRRGDENDDEEDGDDDDVGDDGDMMNWPHLGRFACLPHIRRPALPGFLLGPLSVEKKARKVAKRSAPFRPNTLTETRPEVLNVEDLAKKENDLTAICGKILQRLYYVQAEAQQTVEDLIEDDMDDEEKTKIMHEHGLRSTGGIDLMRFVVNPKSFGQTVENIFYVSFLIRDGRVEVDLDENELPALAPVEREPATDGLARHGASKHQAVLSMDEEVWREIIKVFNITEPMIEHRQESSHRGPGARGWYS